MSIELLEPRIAPASILTFTDVDGDKVKIISSRGDLAGTATLVDLGLGQQLQLLNLTDPDFAGTNLTTIVTKSADGDGLVNIGRINAGGRDLGSVTIHGDLGSIVCGDRDPKTGPGLKFLSVHSMGVFGKATQTPGGSLDSTIQGAVGAVQVSGDLRDASFGASGFADDADGKIGSFIIGGSLIGESIGGGTVFSSGDMGLLKIGGDFVGGGNVVSGGISCNGTLRSLIIGGSILGGGGLFSANVAAGNFGNIKVGGDLRGGTDDAAGLIHSSGKIGSLTIGGSIVGSSGDEQFTDGTHQFNGQVLAVGEIGTITIKHDVFGGSGTGSGSIQSLTKIGSITIGGSLIGGAGDESGKVDVAANLTSLKIGGSIVGGFGSQETITDMAGVHHQGQVFVGGDLGTVQVGRDVLGGDGAVSGTIRSVGKTGSVTIAGSLVGSTGFNSGGLISGGDLARVKIGGNLAGGLSLLTGVVLAQGKAGSISIGGSILGGPDDHTGEISIGGRLDALAIGRNLQGGNLPANQSSTTGSGYVHADRIGSVFVGGSIITGLDQSNIGSLIHNASIRAAHEMGPITVRGNLIGNNAATGFTPVIIAAAGLGPSLPEGATTDFAIKSLTVQGRVEFTEVLGGFALEDTEAFGSNGNASIGPVKVGASWTASSISAGVQDRGPLGFGTDGDSVINSPNGAANDTIVARIVSIAIKGVVAGSPNLPFQSGFVAQQIGSFQSGGFTPRLTAGNDGTIVFPSVATNETIREI